MEELISRQQAMDAIKEAYENDEMFDGYEYRIQELPSIEPEIIRCKDCKYWNKGSCECREHAVNCQDYMVGDIETEAEHFCGYAEKKEVTT